LKDIFGNKNVEKESDTVLDICKMSGS